MTTDPGARAWDCVRATNILHTFALAVDEQEIDSVLACFRVDAELTTPRRSWRGIEEIREFFAAAWAADPSAKRHFVATPRVTWLGPGRVRLEAYFSFIGRLPEQSVLGWGRYDHVVDVRGEQPLLERAGMESHLRTDLAAGWPQPS
jgi:hypothetical protein